MNKNAVILLGDVGAGIRAGIAVDHWPVAIQVKNVEEALFAAENGAGIIMVDTGQLNVLETIHHALSTAGLRSGVTLAFGGGVRLKDLYEAQHLGAQAVDVGHRLVGGSTTRCCTLPLTFVATMLLGGVLGFCNVKLPLMESGIAASIIALGLLVAVAARPPLWLAGSLTALFAVSHGVAHGLHLPELASPWGYALGLVSATAVLHAFGYALVRSLPQVAAPLGQLTGAVSAAAGAWLLLN